MSVYMQNEQTPIDGISKQTKFLKKQLIQIPSLTYDNKTNSVLATRFKATKSLSIHPLIETIGKAELLPTSSIYSVPEKYSSA